MSPVIEALFDDTLALLVIIERAETIVRLSCPKAVRRHVLTAPANNDVLELIRSNLSLPPCLVLTLALSSLNSIFLV
jgi:hypothetical protein